MTARTLHEACTSPAQCCPNLPERAARVTPADVGDGVTTSLREVRTDEVVQLCRCIRGAAQTAQVGEGVRARPRTAQRDLDRQNAARTRAASGGPLRRLRPRRSPLKYLGTRGRDGSGAVGSGGRASVSTPRRAHPVPIVSDEAGQRRVSGFAIRLRCSAQPEMGDAWMAPSGPAGVRQLAGAYERPTPEPWEEDRCVARVGPGGLRGKPPA